MEMIKKNNWLHANALYRISYVVFGIYMYSQMSYN